MGEIILWDHWTRKQKVIVIFLHLLTSRHLSRTISEYLPSLTLSLALSPSSHLRAKNESSLASTHPQPTERKTHHFCVITPCSSLSCARIHQPARAHISLPDLPFSQHLSWTYYQSNHCSRALSLPLIILSGPRNPRTNPIHSPEPEPKASRERS